MPARKISAEVKSALEINAVANAVSYDTYLWKPAIKIASRTPSPEGKKKANLEHLKKIAPLALGHRLRRNPLDDSSSGARIDRAMQEFFATK